MAATLEDPQQPALEEDSSVAPLDDIEKTQPSDFKETIGGSANNFQRPVNGFKWFLVCVGLYLGAVLYGEHIYAVFIK